MGLIGQNKHFLHLTTGAPASIHDARLLRRPFNLGDTGQIPLVSIGDSSFPRLRWLIKSFNENTRDQKEIYCNKKLCAVLE